MSISCAHLIWHDRQWRSPLMVTRHSKHTPIPQSAPRGSPLTERRRVVVPLNRIAASAVISSVTPTWAPFTVTENALGMYALGNARRQIGSDRNFGRAPQQLVYKQFCRSQ